MMNVITTRGMPGDTFSQTSTNTAAALTAANILGSSGARAIGALITFDSNDIKYCMGGATPVSSALGHIADVSVNPTLWLDSGNAVKTFKFISAVAGAHGVIHVTPFFEHGKT